MSVHTDLKSTPYPVTIDFGRRPAGSSSWLLRQRSDGIISGVGDAGNSIHTSCAMKLLQSLDDTGTSLTIQLAANEARRDLGLGRSKIQKGGRSLSERRRSQTSPLALAYWVLCATCVLSTLVVSADAADPGGRHGRRWRHDNVVRQYEEILLDHSPMPTPSYGILGKRQDDPAVSDQRSPSSSLERPSFAPTAAAVDETDTARTDVVSPEDTPSTTSTSDPSSTSTPGAQTENFVLPKPFDAGLGTNYTQQSCPTFLRSMVSNETFSRCLPLSLLLQNSVSFFTASREKNQIDQTLAVTCNVVFPACSAIMASFAQQLRSSSNCQQDWERQNMLVSQAYNGLIAYEPLYKAGCLKDDNQKHCFANAITNTSSPSDLHVYFLPLGMPLPGPSQPTCSKCLAETMNIFQDAASNRSQPISPTYVDAAQMIGVTCGPTFINTTLPLPIAENSWAASSRPMVSSISGFCIAFGLVWLHFVVFA